MSSRPHRVLSGLLAGVVALSGATVLVGAGATAAQAVAGPAPVCSGSTCTVTFDYTGAVQGYAVPAGVTQVDLATYGAQGGSGFLSPGSGGGVSRGTLAVTPSQELSVLVGEAGATGGGRTFGGGGAVGSAGSYYVGAGGGGSFVFDSSGALLLAAGGGAGRYNVSQVGGAGAGAGQSGGDGQAQSGSYNGGGGGTQSAGGAGGSASYGFAGSAGAGPAAASTPGAGGNGGPAGLGGGGSGGGGGYYGGGGGSAYASGGGGSGYAAPALTSVSAEQGTRGGNGAVTVSWTRAPSTVGLTAAPAGSSVRGVEVTFTATVSSDGQAPTGTVDFTDGGAPLCPGAVVSSAGVATCTTSTLSPGTHTIGAAYGGDLLVAPGSGGGSHVVTYEPLVIGTTSLPGGTFGSDYELQLEAADGLAPYTWAVTGGSLPAGLSLSPQGLISGTAGAAGTTAPITFRASDAQSPADSTTWTSTLTIAKAEQQLSFVDPVQGGRVGGTWQPTTTDGGSGNARTFATGSGTTADACSVSAGTVSFDHVGWCEVEATQPADADHARGLTSWIFHVDPQDTQVEVTLSEQYPAHGHQVTGTATSSARGTLQWALAGTDLGDPVAVVPGTAVDAPALPATLPSGSAYAVTATFAPEDPTVDGATVGRASFAVSVAEAELDLSVSAGRFVATARNAVAGDAGVPTGEVSFSVDGEPVGSAPLVAARTTGLGLGLLPLRPVAVATLSHTLPSGGDHEVTAVYDGDADFTGASDSTARAVPVVTTSLSSARPASASGWFSSPVTVSFRCTVTGAPLVAPCPAPVVLSRSAAGQSVTRTVVAQDGGAATATVTGIDIDRDAPGVRVVGTGSRARCSATDALSGVAGCAVTRTKSRGRTRVVATAVDRAGNVATTGATSRLRGPKVLRSTYEDERWTVRAGRRYTVAAWSKPRPRLLAATPAGRAPGRVVARFKGTGHGRWASASIVIPSDARGSWQLGVRRGTRTVLVPLRVVG